ncbi:CcmD family protein [Aquirufa regiilacus]|jgi:CcmD family protein|uniref:CcmD family protein n=1 Tax=Aquirufa regiilacus TaxID=3024868 RepID=A0ABU3TUA4_9BACT|nr:MULTISPECIES: CcmD family protein [unclassified Aquirufa]MDT8887533.1 CcmD family protein [Aquirufa sp. LEPPI-3A]MDU0809455.1 CcmD family protein [Aquirufa sp. LEOWEIH-7C]
MKKYIFSLFMALISFAGQAQAQVEMADQFRADGKIYVVIAIVAIILTGIFIYLFRLDRKITDLEKRIK